MSAVSGPFLAIVVTGRNDDHGGDLTRRFFQVLRVNEQRLRAAGVDCEIVLVEWRPWSNRPWLSTLLADAFPDLVGQGRLGSYVVDERYHSAFGLNGEQAFSESVGRNIGIRRARAPFIVTTRHDVCLSRQAVERMRPDVLQPRTLYRAAGSGHFLLMGTEAFRQIQGFNEIQRRSPIHLDQNFCLKVRSMGLPIVDLDEPVYDLDPETPDKTSVERTDHSESTPDDHLWSERIVYQNHEQWGLGSAPERRISDHTTFLEFDWHAVPPLIDLNRVSLAAYRLTQSGAADAATRDQVELQ